MFCAQRGSLFVHWVDGGASGESGNERVWKREKKGGKWFEGIERLFAFV